jgi:hypothetical protein
MKSIVARRHLQRLPAPRLDAQRTQSIVELDRGFGRSHERSSYDVEKPQARRSSSCSLRALLKP